MTCLEGLFFVAAAWSTLWLARITFVLWIKFLEWLVKILPCNHSEDWSIYSEARPWNEPMIQGHIHYICNECKEEWSGDISQDIIPEHIKEALHFAVTH